MKISLIALLVALLVVPAFSQPVSVGGSFGANWLATNGNTGIIPNATGLWGGWGQIPLGNILENGKLVSTGNSGDTQLIYPAFVTNPTPIIGNKSINSAQYYPRGLTAADLASPWLSEDPWAIAQSTGQPVLSQGTFP
jgi:hypothetical protein